MYTGESLHIATCKSHPVSRQRPAALIKFIQVDYSHLIIVNVKSKFFLASLHLLLLWLRFRFAVRVESSWLGPFGPVLLLAAEEETQSHEECS